MASEGTEHAQRFVRFPSHDGNASLVSLIGALARDEGSTPTLHPHVVVHRWTRPITFNKNHAFGPTLLVVAQGAKIARFKSFDLTYDETQSLVVTDEQAFSASVTAASPARPFLSACIGLPTELVVKALLALADVEQTPVAERTPAFVARLDARLRDVLVRLFEAINDSVDCRVLAPLALEELVFLLLRSEAATVIRRAVSREHDTPAIDRALRFIESNATRSLTVEDIARHVGMSASHFAHRFRAVARVSPKRYLKRVRLERARTLLLGGTRVSEVATQVGYESASHFTRDFKSCFGAAPAEYARRIG